MYTNVRPSLTLYLIFQLDNVLKMHIGVHGLIGADVQLIVSRRIILFQQSLGQEFVFKKDTRESLVENFRMRKDKKAMFYLKKKKSVLTYQAAPVQLLLVLGQNGALAIKHV